MKLLFKVLLVLAILPLYSQNTLKGHVTDVNNIAISDANVYFPLLEKGASTNTEGEFYIENIPSGNHKLVISVLGYETKSLNISFPTNGDVIIQLTASAIEMENIIISTPFHQLQSENVMKVEHKNVSDLKAQGAVNLADGIDNISGVSTISSGLGIGKPVIRGLSSNRVVVYTQGIRLENQQYGDEHGLGLSSSGIESIEVIKGPASLLYGSDALGGVLYLNPEKFADAKTMNADATGNYYSNTHGYDTNIGVKQSGEHFKLLLRGSTTEHSDYNTNTYRVTNTRFREQDLKAGIGYQYNTFKTELRYNVNQSKLGIVEGIGEQSTNRTPLLPFQDITNHVLSSKSTLFFNKSKLDINLGYIHNNRNEFEEDHEHGGDEEHLYETPSLNMVLKTINYDIKYHLPEFGKLETIIGVQGMNQTNSNFGEEQLIPNAITNDFGVLATSHIHFDNLDIQLGARFDNRFIEIENNFNKDYKSFNGALGAKRILLKNIVLRVNLATGFRAPNLAELKSEGEHHGTNRYEIGNSNLKSEQNFQTDLALEYKTKHIEIFANGFYNTINNYIFISPNGNIIDSAPVFIYTQNHANLYGGEFGCHFHPHPLDWLHFDSSFETVTGKQQNGNYLPLIPANAINNTLRAEFNTMWLKKGYTFITLKHTLNQNNTSPFETPTKAFNLLSAGFGGTINVFKNPLDICVSGTNLLDTLYINHLSRLKTDGIFNMGRNISIGITYNL